MQHDILCFLYTSDWKTYQNKNEFQLCHWRFYVQFAVKFILLFLVKGDQANFFFMFFQYPSKL